MGSFVHYECNDLWFASLNGDYKGRVWLRDSFFVMLYYLIKDVRSDVQNGLDRIVEIIDVGGRPAVCFDSNLSPVDIHDFSTGKLANLQNEVFESYEDLQERVGFKEPIKHISERIMDEITGQSRMNLFVKR